MLLRNMRPTLFPTGQLVCTPRVMEEICPYEVAEAFDRHRQGDWGIVCEHDKLENDVSLEENLRLKSGYFDSNGKLFWIVTAPNRSATTILLPEEY